MRAAYFVVSLAVVALGVVHVIATPRYFASLTTTALWFASGGIAIALTGVLNLLNRTYGAAAPGLRNVSICTNAVMTVFAGLTGQAGKASVGEFVFVITLMGSATILSILPAARRRGPEPPNDVPPN